MKALNPHDLGWILRRLPREVLQAMKNNPNRVFLAGGFIRSCIAKEEVQDIDLFAESKASAQVLASQLTCRNWSAGRINSPDPKYRIHQSDNAISIHGFKHMVQIIHRWTYDSPEQCLLSFDFTIAQAAVWWKEGLDDLGEWASLAAETYYEDLCAKRLVYTSPERNEDAGGSFLRLLKFYQRDYRAPMDTMGKVISRLLRGVRMDNTVFWQGVGTASNSDFVPNQEELDAYRSKIVTGLLREVDPNVDPNHLSHLPALDDQKPEEFLESLIGERPSEDGPTDAQLSQSTERHWQEEEKYRSEMKDAGRGGLLPP